MKNLEIKSNGEFSYVDSKSFAHSANFPLFLIGAALRKGCSFEKEADGFGAGLGTMGGDWSGIRDSSNMATEVMLTKAIDFLGLEG